MRVVSCFFLILALGSSALSAEQDRLLFPAKIKGRDVVLALDTGAPHYLSLFNSTIKKLELETQDRDGMTTSSVMLENMGHSQNKIEAIVMPVSFIPDVDGVIGFPALNGRIWSIDWNKMSIAELSSVPEGTRSWQGFELNTELPLAASSLGLAGNDLVYLDTGDPGGVSLSGPAWEKWRNENNQTAVTLAASYNPTLGFTVSELRWSRILTLGQLAVSEISVQKSYLTWPRLRAVLGLDAMKNFEMIWDLKKNRIYLKTRTRSREGFTYNRLGATFAPMSAGSGKLVGRVLENSPAYRAGLREGDILLKIDDTDMTRWQSDPGIMKKRFWFAPAGTTYRLEVEREGKSQSFKVVLEELLPIPK